MNFRKVIQTYGYPIISKEVSKRVSEYHNAERKGTLESSNAYKEFNGILLSNDGQKSIYNKEKWKFLVESDFKISNKCCDIMKKKPLHQYEKQTGFHAIVGTLAEESQSRKKSWYKTGCNAFDSKTPISKPMSFWTEQDVLEYINKYVQPIMETLWKQAQFSHGSMRKKARKQLKKINYIRYSYASVYGEILQDDNGKYYTTGCNRTGCVFCGFGCHLEKEPNRFQMLKETHPKLWNYCMKPWDDGGLGMKKVLQYIGVKYE